MSSSDDYEILAVRTDLIDSIWPHVAPLFQKPVDLSHDRLSLDHILEGAKADEYMIWLVTHKNDGIVAALTTRISAYPKRLALSIDFVGGSQMSGWLATALEALEAHARRNNCTLIEGFGRPAWGRVLGRFKWHPAYTVYHLDLDAHVQGQEKTSNHDADDD